MPRSLRLHCGMDIGENFENINKQNSIRVFNHHTFAMKIFSEKLNEKSESPTNKSILKSSNTNT